MRNAAIMGCKPKSFSRLRLAALLDLSHTRIDPVRKHSQLVIKHARVHLGKQTLRDSGGILERVRQALTGHRVGSMAACLQLANAASAKSADSWVRSGEKLSHLRVISHLGRSRGLLKLPVTPCSRKPWLALCAFRSKCPRMVPCDNLLLAVIWFASLFRE